MGPPRCLSAVGEDGAHPMLVFNWPLLARVLIGVDDIVVTEIIGGVVIVSRLAHALRVRTRADDPQGEHLGSGPHRGLRPLSWRGTL